MSDASAALEGARAILVERFAEDATLIGTLREEVWSRGRLCSRVRAGKAEPGTKFANYFEFSEPLAKLPSHRILALSRGEKEEILILELLPDSARAGSWRGRRLRAADRQPVQDRRSWSARRPLADRYGALGLADEDPGSHRKRPAPSALASC